MSDTFLSRFKPSIKGGGGLDTELTDISFGPHDASFRTLWEDIYNAGKINSSAEYDSYCSKLSNFAAEFFLKYDLDAEVYKTTIGHPFALIDYFCELFLERLVVDESSSISSKSSKSTPKFYSGLSWVILMLKTEKEKSKKVVISESIQLYVNKVILQSLEKESSDAISGVEEIIEDKVPKDQQGGRNHSRTKVIFLISIHVISVLCRFPHNRAYISLKFGSYFGRLINELIKSLHIKLDDLIVNFSDAKDDISVISTRLQENTNFVLSTLFALVQYNSYSAITTNNSTSLISHYTELFSSAMKQPLGHSYVTKVFDVDLFCSNIPTLNDKISDSHYTKFDTFNLLNYKNFNFSSVSSDSNTLTILQQHTDDLISNCGAIRVIFSVARKLSYLSKTIIGLMANDSRLSIDMMQFIRRIWRFTLILQAELLASSIFLIDAKPVNALKSLSDCSGLQAMESLLSLKDVPNHYSFDKMELQIIFQRSILCLKLNEIAMKNEYQKINSDSTDDPMIVLNSIEPLIMWLIVISSNKLVIADINQTKDIYKYNKKASCNCPLVLSEAEYESAKKLTSIPYKSDQNNYRYDFIMSSLVKEKINTSSKEYGSNPIAFHWLEFFQSSDTHAPESSQKHLIPNWLFDNIFANFCFIFFDTLSNSLTFSRKDETLADFTPLKKIMGKILKVLQQEVETPQIPIFHCHFLIFIAKCLKHPSYSGIVQIFQEVKLWKILLQSSIFLQSGLKSINRLFNAGHKNLYFSDTPDNASTTNENLKWVNCSIEKVNVSISNVSKSVSLVATAPVEFISTTTSESDAGFNDAISSNESTSMGISATEVDMNSTVNVMGTIATESAPVTPVTIALVEENSYSNDEIAFDYKIMHDVIFEILALIPYKVMKDNVISSNSSGMFDIEIDCVLGALTIDSQDDVIIQVCRWLYFVICISQNKLISKDMMANITTKVSSLCKHQYVSTANGMDFYDYCQDFSKTKQNKPFYWPARVAVLELINIIMTTSTSQVWLKSFYQNLVPKQIEPTETNVRSNEDVMREQLRQSPQKEKSSTRMTQEQSSLLINSGSSHNSNRILRHSALIRYLLLPRCFDFVLSILVKLFKGCASQITQISNDLQKGEDNSSNNNNNNNNNNEYLIQKQQISIIEALAHDIIKWLTLIIRQSSKQPDFTQLYTGALKIIQVMTQQLVNCPEPQIRKKCRELIVHFGPMTVYHQIFSWTQHRSNIFTELIYSIDDANRKAKKWTQEMRSNLLRNVFSFYQSFIHKNPSAVDQLQQALLNRQKSSSSSNAEFTYCYEEIINIIVSIEPDPQIETIIALFNMIFDTSIPFNMADVENDTVIRAGLFANSEVKPTIENTAVITLLLGLVPVMKNQYQYFVLNTFKNLLVGEGSLVNLSKIVISAQPSMLELLLDMFPKLKHTLQESAMTLLQIIGKFNISVSQMKRVFRLLQRNEDKRPPYTRLIIKALQGMISDADGPTQFIFFQGEGCGIVLPPLQKWSRKGYSVSTWFCIGKKYGKISSKKFSANTYNPTLLSFRQKNGIGFEVSFIKRDENSSSSNPSANSNNNIYTIEIKSYPSENPKDMQVATFELVTSKGNDNVNDDDLWHHLAFSHVPSYYKFGSKSEIHALIDGKEYTQNLSFPKFNDTLDYPFIGDTHPKLRSKDNNTFFCGQMAALYLFSDPLSVSQLRSIYSLRASYCQVFSDRESMSSGSNQLLDGSLTGSIMLAFNPGVYKGQCFLDITPETNSNRCKMEKKWEPEKLEKDVTYSQSFISLLDDLTSIQKDLLSNNNLQAYRLEGTNRCTAKDMRKALDCLGGIKVLLPIFTQLDLPIDTNESDNRPTSGDDQTCSEILHLVFSLLRSSPENQRFVSNGGFGLIAYLLKNISPVHLNINTLDTIVNMTDRLSLDVWKADVMKNIICNFKLWIRSSYEVQSKLFAHILRWSNLNIKDKLCYNAMPYQKLIDGLGLYVCSEHPSTYDSSNSSSTMNKLTYEQTNEIRQIILHMLNNQFHAWPSIVDEGTQSLINYIYNESISKYRIEALHYLMNLLSPSKPDMARSVINKSSGRKCVVLLLSLFSNSEVKIRLYSLLCFCSLIHAVLEVGRLPVTAQTRGCNDIDGQSADVDVWSEAQDLVNPSASAPSAMERQKSLKSDKLSLKDSNKENSDNADEKRSTFDELDIPIQSLTGYFQFIIATLFEKMKIEKVNDRRCYNFQCEIIFKALNIAMHGLSCKRLLNNIENYFKENHDDIPDDEYLHLSSARVCVPMILPAMLTFIRNSIDTAKKRSQYMIELKTSIQNFDSFDSLLSIREWQSDFFKVFASEQAYIDKLEDEFRLIQWNGDLTYPLFNDVPPTDQKIIDEMEELKRSYSILEIIILFFNEVHIHAIRFGLMSYYSSLLTPKGEASFIQYNSLNASEFLDILHKGNRGVGMSVLRETISCMRCFGERGDIDCRETGARLLQLIIDAVVRENESLNLSLTDSPESKKLKKNMLNVNIWVMASVILEFITVPPFLQRTRGFRTPTSKKNSASKNTDGSDGDRSRSQSLGDGNEIRNSISSRSSGSDEGESFSIESGDSQSKLLSTRNRCYSNSGIVKSNSRHSLETLASTGVSSPPPLSNNKNAGDSWISAYREELDDDAYNNKLWKLVENLLDVIGPMDGASTWFSLNMRDKVQFGSKFGYRLGRQVFSTFENSVLNIMDPAIVDNGKNNSQGTGTIGGKYGGSAITPSTHVGDQNTVIGRSIDGVFWIIIRVLLNIYIQGGSKKANLDSSSPSVLALKRLSQLMDGLKEKDRDYYDIESIYIIGKISEAIKKDPSTPSNSAWYMEGLKYMVNLLFFQRGFLLNKLQDLLKKREDPTASKAEIAERESLSALITVIQSASPKENINIHAMSENEVAIIDVVDRASQAASSKLSRASIFSKNANLKFQAQKNLELILAQVESMCNDKQFNELSISDIALESLRLSLEISNNDSLTWKLWDSGIDPAVEEARKIEDSIITYKLTEQGLHKHAQLISNQLHKSQANEAKISNSLKTEIRKHVKEHQILETRRNRELLRIELSENRESEKNWRKLKEEVASERGAWGTIKGSSNVTWTLSDIEGENKTRQILMRAPKRTTHEITSKLSQSSNSDDYKAEDFAQRNSENIAEKYKLDLSLFKDLKNFINKSGNQEDLNADNDLEDDDNDEINTSLDEYAGKDGVKQDHHNAAVVEFKPLSSHDISNDSLVFQMKCDVIKPTTSAVCLPSTGVISLSYKTLIFTKFSDLGVNRQITQFTVSIPTINGKEKVKNEIHTVSNISGAENTRKTGTSYIWESLPECQPFPTTEWDIEDICNVQQKYYLLRFVAVEIFFSSRTTVLLTFDDKNSASRFIQVIRKKVKPPFLNQSAGWSKEILLTRTPNHFNGSAHTLTGAWVNREISNFDYLMLLNTIAGRNVKDLGQYPVFPWIVKDYTSSEIKLKDPNTYRDLHWGMGAQTEDARYAASQKYNELEMNYDEALRPFNHGTHYSASGFVIGYLFRCEPFTSLLVQLGDGKFDKPDRMFNSIESAFKCNTSNSSDVRELVPELFSCPEVLQNINLIDFGETQSGRKVDHIDLPRWAKDAYEFIFYHREALESDYVSENLHHWIDLIFGYKQRPPHCVGGSIEAVKACNVYCHITYADAINLDDLKKMDTKTFAAIEAQIQEYGQTPSQLFSQPHPQRNRLCDVDLIWPIASIVRGADTIIDSNFEPEKPKNIISFKPYVVSTNPIILIEECGDDRLITVDTARIMGFHSWQKAPPDVVPPFQFSPDRFAFDLAQGQTTFSTLSSLVYSRAGNSYRDRRIGVPFAPSLFGLSSGKSDSTNGSERWKPVNIQNYVKNERQGGHEKEKSKTRERSATSRTGSIMNITTGGGGGGNADYDGRSLVSSSAKTLSKASTLNSEKIITFDDSSETRNRNHSFSTPVSSRSGDSSQRSAGSAKVKVSSKSSSGLNSSTSASSAPSRQSSVREEHLSANLFCVIPELRLLYSCGHWDNSLRVTSVDTGKLVESVSLHSDVITCLAHGKDLGYIYLATGSRDCTLMMWQISIIKGEPLGVSKQPKYILYGHDEPVNCVNINVDIDIIASGSDDGTVIVHTLREGVYIRTIVDGNRTPIPSLRQDLSLEHVSDDMHLAVAGGHRRVTWIGISKQLFIITYSADDRKLCTYSINGHLLVSKIVSENIYAFLFSECGHVLLTGGDNCLVVLRWVRNLELAKDGPRRSFEAVLDGSMKDISFDPFKSPIRSLYMTKQERHLLVGLESGELRILAQDSDYLRQRLQRKLQEIGIL